MVINVLIKIIDEKVLFFLDTTSKFIDNFDENMSNLYTKPFYQCDYKNINSEVLDKKIKEKIEEINKFNTIKFKEYDLLINQDDFANVETIYNFLTNNNNLNFVLKTDDYKEILNKFGNKDVKNLKICFKNSEEYIPYKDFYDMYYKLDEIKKFVQHYNLSPLEQVLLVYDIVKANEYAEVDLDQNFNVSRDLNQIIKGDKIVCVGFANLIDFLLTNLGFDTNFILTKYNNKYEGHIRNYLHLVDEKYNIDSVFALDATWDSKKNEEYLDNYLYFLKPIKFFFQIKKTEYITSPDIFNFFKTDRDNFIKKMNEIYKNNKFLFLKIITKLAKAYTNKHLYSTLFLLNDDNKINEILNEIYTKYNTKISRESFKSALYKVRKIEYLNNLIKFEPNEDHLDSVCDKYFKLPPELNLLMALGHKDQSLKKDLQEAKAKSVEEDLLRIRFIKALKTELNDFPDNDYIKKM